MNKLLMAMGMIALITACKDKKEEAVPADYNLVIETQDGEFKYNIEEAVTKEEMNKGLQGRESLAENSGMIFNIFGYADAVMWMKNTNIPLDMVFLDESGTVTYVYEDAIPHSEEFIHPPKDTHSVLEMNAGDVKKNNIQVGDKVKHKWFNEEDGFVKPATLPAEKPMFIDGAGEVGENISTNPALEDPANIGEMEREIFIK